MQEVKKIEKIPETEVKRAKYIQRAEKDNIKNACSKYWCIKEGNFFYSWGGGMVMGRM
jgi:hypothetical protein